MSAEKNRVAAVVVTYNRLPLLQKCIESLHAQTASCDILVVNNASTDGTGPWLAAQEAAGVLMARDTGENLGGAGGFNKGIRWAVEAGYDYLWVMDDDCLPEPDALEKLLEADRLLDGNYGWLSSVALWKDGSECKMNRQKLKKSFYEYSPLMKYGIVQAEQATFVSLFLRTETVRKFGLPIKEFFIWGDDIEYTRRVAVRGKRPCFVAGQSQVVHAMKDNNGSSIALDAAERINRYRYAFRNEAYTYRQEGLKGMCYYLAKCGLNICRIVVLAPDHKWKRVRVLIGSMVEGAYFRPKIEMVKRETTFKEITTKLKRKREINHDCTKIDIPGER